MDFKKKTRLASILALALSLSLTHCEFLGLEEDSDDDSALFGLLLVAAASTGGCATAAPINLSGEITSNITVQCGVLNGAVFVRSGASLTVPAGGQIFGADGSSLFVLQGGRLNAVGTAANPIVFSSAQAVGSRKPGDWGGIVLVGNARTNGGQLQTEGVNPQNYGDPASTNDADSSGALSYVRIEYAGDTLSNGDELNCLSLYAVGSGTQLDHVQCHMGRDDSFEFFGGAVNGKFLLATGTADDDFDLDVGYHGSLQHIIGYKFADGSSGAGSTDPRGFEFDGSDSGNPIPLAATYPTATLATIANFTLVGSKGVFTGTPGTNAEQMRLRRGTLGHLAHGYVTGFAGTLDIDCPDSGSITVHDTVFTQTGTTKTGAGCTNNAQTTLPGSGIVALGSEVDFNAGTPPNLTPTATVTGQTALFTQNAAYNNGFFDNTTYAGAIDPAGVDWTLGWTTWVNK